jgi:iron complex outermembrane receptor protein
MLRLTLMAGTAAILTPATVAAQTVTRDRAPDRVQQHEQSPEIIVTAPFVRELDILAGTSVLTGANLQRDIRPQIGDTLTRLPGVSATSFSPGASRPVLRGFQGERIRVLTDGIGSIDVSNTSADHAVTIDPLTSERIEVLHGPAVLLFGGQAIGGAVNVIDRRIPRVVPEGGFHVDLIGVYGSAADERSIGGAADFAIGNSGLVFHVDGSFRETDDLRVGGFVLSPGLRGRTAGDRCRRAGRGPCRGGGGSARARGPQGPPSQQRDRAEDGRCRPRIDPRRLQPRRFGELVRQRLRRADAPGRRPSPWRRRGRGRRGRRRPWRRSRDDWPRAAPLRSARRG